MMLDFETYYSLDRILAHNKPLNVIFGGMGTGKTTAILAYLKDILESGEQFVLIKDYESHFTNESTVELLNNELLGLEGFTCKNQRIYHDKKLVGYTVGLNTYEKWKGPAYPLVNTFLFDEIDTHSGRKLQEQTFALTRTCQTFARKRDFRLFATANLVTAYVPFCSDFGIDTFTMEPGDLITSELIAVECLRPSRALLKLQDASLSGQMLAALGKREEQLEGRREPQGLYACIIQIQNKEDMKPEWFIDLREQSGRSWSTSSLAYLQCSQYYESGCRYYHIMLVDEPAGFELNPNTNYRLLLQYKADFDNRLKDARLTVETAAAANVLLEQMKGWWH